MVDYVGIMRIISFGLMGLIGIMVVSLQGEELIRLIGIMVYSLTIMMIYK